MESHGIIRNFIITDNNGVIYMAKYSENFELVSLSLFSIGILISQIPQREQSGKTVCSTTQSANGVLWDPTINKMLLLFEARTVIRLLWISTMRMDIILPSSSMFWFDLSLFNSDTTVVYHKIYNVVFFIAGTGQYCATYCMWSCLSVADEWFV